MGVAEFSVMVTLPNGSKSKRRRTWRWESDQAMMLPLPSKQG